MTVAQSDTADQVTEQLARQLIIEAQGEVLFMQQKGIPPELGRHLAVQALRRAAIMMEAER